MAIYPKTSESMFQPLADHDKKRWDKFYKLYKPLLAAWLSGRFKKSVNDSDIEDIVQDTMIAFMRKVPNYHYAPKVKGPFHSYLLMIANNKALSLLRSRTRKPMIPAGHGEDIDRIDDKEKFPGSQFTDDDKELAEIAKVAIHQVLNNKSTSVRDREVFTRTTNGESPESVAEAFGITRNNVDQIKARIMRKVREIAEDLNRAE